MPIWLRKFTFNKLNEFYLKEAEQHENAQNKGGNKSTLVDSSGKINKEAFKEASPKISSGPKNTPNSKVKYK